MTDPTLNAALIQLSAHAERLALLEDRENTHSTSLGERLAQVTAAVENLGAALSDQAAILDGLGNPDQDETGAGAADAAGEAYRPGPAPRWWKLDGEEREQAIARLRAWVEQVYRPGYGQLAAALGPCWDQHVLCLYGLDILAELWSVLYLQPSRTAGVVSAQAEFQTRILPAITEQLITETARCAHAQARPVSGRAWSQR